MILVRCLNLLDIELGLGAKLQTREGTSHLLTGSESNLLLGSMQKVGSTRSRSLSSSRAMSTGSKQFLCGSCKVTQEMVLHC